jgi:hypothetical protein
MIGEINDSVDKWFSERWSKFTASENWKLLTNNIKGEVFGEPAWTYIKQKALEMVTNMWERPELEEVKSLLHGKIYELPAYERYIQTTKNYNLTYLGGDNPVFLPYDKMPEDSGGSPDIVQVSNGSSIDFGAEIKCPKNPMKHFERLKWKDQWDILQNYKECYTQIQNLMLITGAPEWDFVSFDERMKQKELQIKIITVRTDKKMQDNLHFRLIKAREERKKILQDYVGTML